MAPKTGSTPWNKVTDDQIFSTIMVTDSCWFWMGTKNAQGYGTAGHRGLVHRWMYSTFVGPINQSGKVLHHCDTPACVNPDHLWQGTQAENMADMAAKGRAGHRRFTREQVIAIRSDPRSAMNLGFEYGVSDVAILNIRNRKCYRWVE